MASKTLSWLSPAPRGVKRRRIDHHPQSLPVRHDDATGGIGSVLCIPLAESHGPGLAALFSLRRVREA